MKLNYLVKMKSTLEKAIFTEDIDKLLAYQLYQITNILENKQFGTRKFDKDLTSVLSKTLQVIQDVAYNDSGNNLIYSCARDMNNLLCQQGE